MIKALTILLVIIAPSAYGVDWTSADNACTFVVPAGWNAEPNDEKGVVVQYRNAAGSKAINVSVVSVPANFHVKKEGIIDGIEKSHGKVISYSDEIVDGIPTVTVKWEIPKQFQILVIMKYKGETLYKWQVSTDALLADDVEVTAAASTFKLRK
jgi:hypothetical protein